METAIDRTLETATRRRKSLSAALSVFELNRQQYDALIHLSKGHRLRPGPTFNSLLDRRLAHTGLHPNPVLSLAGKGVLDLIHEWSRSVQ